MDVILVLLAVLKLLLQNPVEYDIAHKTALESVNAVGNIAILLVFFVVDGLTLRGIMGSRKYWPTTWDVFIIKSNTM